MRPLTLAQYRVVAMMVDGRSDQEIAEATGCAQHTVRMHLHDAFRRVGLAGSWAKGRSSTERIRIAAWCMKHRFKSLEEYLEYQSVSIELAHIENIWEQVSKPIKFPAPSRRRRSDREIPKAA